MKFLIGMFLILGASAGTGLGALAIVFPTATNLGSWPRLAIAGFVLLAGAWLVGSLQEWMHRK